MRASCSGGGAALLVGAPDAPLAAFGAPSIFPVPVDVRADAAEGLSFFLMGNLWSTNYPFWYPWKVGTGGDENLRLRFTLTSLPPGGGGAGAQ